VGTRTSPVRADLEARARAWIAPYEQAEHLRRTCAWVAELDAGAGAPLRLAALTHDMERHYAGGPRLDKRGARWDDPDYLFAHSLRSADVVGWWLAEEGVDDAAYLAEVRRLILRHEVGGDRDADLLQTADSLSYLETLGPMTAAWVRDGVCGPEAGRAKLRWMHDRIRDDRARALAAPLLADALDLIDEQEASP
jgi:hypothetical protein